MKKQSGKVILELFSGSRSVSKTFENHGWSSFSVDNNPSLKPTLCCDILDLVPGMLPGHVDFIWASPDCSTFSRAADPNHYLKKTIGYRKYEYSAKSEKAVTALLLVQKTFEIISWFPGVSFILENPIGRFHHLSHLKRNGHHRYFVNYFDFGCGYSKETYLFSSILLPLGTKKTKIKARSVASLSGSYRRSIVPPALIEFILNYI